MKYTFLKSAVILAVCFYISGCKDDMNGPNLPLNCTYSVSTTSLDVAASGSKGSIQVTAGSSCMWTAVSNVPWTEIVTGLSGTGNGTVTYEVKSNSGNQRTGSMTIAGFMISLKQDKIGCNYNLSPAQTNFDANGGSGKIHIQTSSGCGWTAKSRATWIQIVSASDGKGNGTVEYIVANNNSDSDREGKIVIADKIFSVKQSGKIIAYAISGNVGAKGVEIDFVGNNAPPRVFSDAEGNFRQSGFFNGEYVVRPVSPCFDFQPRSTTVLIANNNARDVNFSSKKNLKADAGGPYFTFSGTLITFSALKSLAQNPIRTYSWDFGDGTNNRCDCPTIQHSYPENLSPCPGDVCTRNFPLTLTIRDAQGCEDVDRTEIEITFGY